MNYKEALELLYERTPAFHIIGSEAYKSGLERSLALDELSGNPHKRYKCIHIAGSNGKGSVAHLMAAVLQASGHKTGLYTSPHLMDFCERIRVGGRPITKQFVCDFVNKHLQFIEREKPSFFELTTAMAFDYFRHKKVTYAVIETGLGGRLDSTNIIRPILSIITSISLEHKHILGDTLLQIAGEKAGIIKPGVPVVIGDMKNSEINAAFRQKANELSAPIHFTERTNALLKAQMDKNGRWLFESEHFGDINCELRGPSQYLNAKTILTALKILSESGIQIRLPAIRKAFDSVTKMTGLMGRWQELNTQPKIICDIGHNPGAWEINIRQLHYEAAKCDNTHIIIGVSNDKDIDAIMNLMPENARYYFTQASVARAMPAKELAEYGKKHNLSGECYQTVKEAVYDAINKAAKTDFIFIGGSVFVVAETLPVFPNSIL